MWTSVSIFPLGPLVEWVFFAEKMSFLPQSQSVSAMKGTQNTDPNQWPGLMLTSSITVGWVIWPVEPVPDVTYNVFGVTLTLLNQSITTGLLKKETLLLLLQLCNALKQLSEVDGRVPRERG